MSSLMKSFVAGDGGEEEEEEEEEEELDENIMRSCVVCRKGKKNNFLSCCFCFCFYHKSCLKIHLYTNSACLHCSSYNFVNFHRRNYQPYEILKHYHLQVFYARIFECLRLNARKKIHFLLKNKFVDKDTEDSNGNTLLNVACFYDHIEIVKMLLNQFDFNPYHSNKHQDFATHICAQMNNIEILKFLIKKNPDSIYLLNAQGQLPLHVAIIYNNPDIAYMLISISDVSKLDVEDINRQRPIELCLKKNKHLFSHVIKILISSGCHI
jgi:hypothetical protein